MNRPFSMPVLNNQRVYGIIHSTAIGMTFYYNRGVTARGMGPHLRAKRDDFNHRLAMAASTLTLPAPAQSILVMENLSF